MSPLPHPIVNPAPRAAGRVSIRPVHRREARALRELLAQNRGWLSPWEATFPGTPDGPRQQLPVAQVLRSIRFQQRSGAGITFAITLDGETVGQLSVSDVSGGACRSASIGYWVSQHVAGKGVTPTAVALTIDYLFEELGLHRVEICIRPENQASLRVVQKLGMRHEGRRQRYIHIAGAWRDHECFAVTVEEVPNGMLARLGASAGEASSQRIQ